MIDSYFASAWQPTTAARRPLPIALDLHSLYEQLLRSLLPQPARPGESLPEQLERLTRLRSRHNDYGKPEIRLHGAMHEWFTARGLSAQVSVSDESSYACAFVVVEQELPNE